MKTAIFLILTAFFINSTYSQVGETKIDSTTLSNDESIYSLVEEKPQYVGGIQEFYNYIGKNYRVPNIKGLKGKVIVQFIVEKDGSLTDIKVLRDLGYGTGAEAVRVLEKCIKWIPGKQKGIPVRVMYALPISISS